MALSDQLIEIRGLPAHALLVHLTVVVVPLACLGTLAYLNPKWRDWLRVPLLVVAVIAFVSIWAAFLSGDNFKESVSFFQTGELGERIEEHEELADVLRIVGSIFAVVVVALTTWVHKNGSAAVRTGVAGLAAVLAVVTLVYVVLTGEAGAKAVYPPGSFDSAPVLDIHQ